MLLMVNYLAHEHKLYNPVGDLESYEAKVKERFNMYLVDSGHKSREINKAFVLEFMHYPEIKFQFCTNKSSSLGS